MSMNQEISAIFYEIADLMEIKGDVWRSKAYRAAAQTLESMKGDIQDIYLEKGLKGLEDLPSIGEALAKKIEQYIETEKIDKLEELKKQTPKGLYELLSIPGVGVKKAKLFFYHGIKNAKELEKAAQEHKLQQFEGFKAKSELNILHGLKLAGIEDRISLKEGEKISSRMLKELRIIKEIEKIEVAGSVRRKKETIRDFDFVVQTRNPEIVVNKLVKMDFVKEVLSKGQEKVTIITKENRQTDFRFFSEDEYGAGLLYFTGDKNHNIWLRKLAIKQGLKLNEYGLFKEDKRIAGKSEEDIYRKLGLKYIEPEERIG